MTVLMSIWSISAVLLCGLLSCTACSVPLDDPLRPSVVDEGGPRVAGGRPVGKKAYPWAAQIKLPGDKLCGGALISCQAVVTAAHCIYPFPTSSIMSEGKVVLGNSKKDVGAIFGIADVTVHPNFDSSGFDSSSEVQIQHDIAIITLDEPTYIKPIKLAKSNPRVRKRGYVLGWGETESSSTSKILRRAALQVLDSTECISESGKQYYDPDSSICTGAASRLKKRFEAPEERKQLVQNRKKKPVRSSARASACQGDSGGPFLNLSGKNLWGIVSYAFSSDTSLPACGEEGRQTVLSSVADSRDFILSHLSAERCRPPGSPLDDEPGGSGDDKYESDDESDDPRRPRPEDDEDDERPGGKDKFKRPPKPGSKEKNKKDKNRANKKRGI